MDRQKEKAVEYLRNLEVWNNFINQFAENGQVTVFNAYKGKNISEYSEVQQKIKEIEAEYGCLVYAVTYERLSFGECFSFLVVSKYEEDWELSLRYLGNNLYSALAYVWNKTDDRLSEFGSVVVGAAYGGLLRMY